MSLSALYCSLVLVTTFLISETESSSKCISCRCGASNKNYTHCIEIEEIEDQTCDTWSQCKTCKDNTPFCITCPPKQFGALCTGVVTERIRIKRQIATEPSTHCENDGSIHNGRVTVLRALTQPLRFEEEDFELPVGTRLHYSCDKGFVLEGPAVLICENNGYWSEPKPPSCVKDPTVYCSNPDQISHASYRKSDGLSATPDRYLAGESVIYSCQDGYDLVGKREVICMPSSAWSSKPACTRATDIPTPINSLATDENCPDPGSIQFGYRRFINVISPRSRTINHGQSIRYFCNQGYLLQGDNVLTCLNSGKWSSSLPTCLEINPSVNCPDPGSVEDGFRRLINDIPTMLSGTYTSGQSFMYFCNYGYELQGINVLTCLTTGQWSSNTPRCQRSSLGLVGSTRRKRQSIGIGRSTF